MTSVSGLFYPPSPARGDLSLSMSTDQPTSSSFMHSRYQYQTEPQPAGLLNEGGLSYMSVPLTSPANEENPVAEPTVTPTPSKHPRLLSLDCFRGLVISWMIMADETGDAWTNILDHSPWDGIRFADFVFPAFVFIVGMAVPLSTSKFAQDRWGATRKALWRAIKMFIVGFISASGGFPQPIGQADNNYRLAGIRIPGILQRIAFCYFVTVLIHVWVPVRDEEHTPNSIAYGRSKWYIYKKYIWQFVAALGLIAIYLILTFGTNVPNCGYGKLDPECNASGYWDRTIIGLSHMYQNPTLQRSEACSSNYPADDPRPGRPFWCDRPYDPEGILGTFTACVTGFFGLLFGHILANETKHTARLKHWFSISTICMALGLIIHFAGIPVNKNLWSISYVFVMVGVDGIVFSAFYWVVDMQGVKRVTWPVICMGMNAILVFVMAQSDMNVDGMIQWFYLDKPDQNLYHWYNHMFLAKNVGESWAIFLWGWTKVFSWLAISVWLHHEKIFWKL